jgi:hypothetical protein
MVIPDVSRERLLEALEEFDRSMRNSPDWRSWEERKFHKYVIVNDGRHYPMKQIISMATGADRSSFHGGKQSWSYILDRNLEVEALRLPAEGEVQVALHDLLLSRHLVMSSGLSNSEKQKLGSACGNLQRISISEATRTLVENKIGVGEALFFAQCYGLRGAITHSGATGDLASKVYRLNRIVSDLIVSLAETK